MSGHKLWVWIVVLSIIVLGGCQRWIKITVKDLGDRSPTFILEPPGLLAWDGVEVSGLEVFEFDRSKNVVKEMMWRIVSVDGEPRHVDTIKFGNVPDGFRELRPPKQLLPGQTYEVSAGGPGSTGGVSFVPQ